MRGLLQRGEGGAGETRTCAGAGVAGGAVIAGGPVIAGGDRRRGGGAAGGDRRRGGDQRGILLATRCHWKLYVRGSSSSRVCSWNVCPWKLQEHMFLERMERNAPPPPVPRECAQYTPPPERKTRPLLYRRKRDECRPRKTKPIRKLENNIIDRAILLLLAILIFPDLHIAAIAASCAPVDRTPSSSCSSLLPRCLARFFPRRARPSSLAVSLSCSSLLPRPSPSSCPSRTSPTYYCILKTTSWRNDKKQSVYTHRLSKITIRIHTANNNPKRQENGQIAIAVCPRTDRDRGDRTIRIHTVDRSRSRRSRSVRGGLHKSIYCGY